MKKEDVNIKPFLDFYLKGKAPERYIPIPEGNGKTPDYYIPSEDTLIEVKEIHDQKDLKRHSQWGTIASKLQKAIDASQLINKVVGSYLIDTPHTYKSPTDTGSFKKAAEDVIKAVIRGSKMVKVFKYDFKITRVSKKGNYISFGTSGPGGSFDAAQTIFENIHGKLRTANTQLGFQYNNKTQSKKIVLLVNKYQLLFWDWDLYKGVSYLYDDLISYSNIDEIWFQNELKTGGFSHRLVFRRTFFGQFESGDLTSYGDSDLNLFADWFSALEGKGDEKKLKLLNALKVFLGTKKPYELFQKSTPREEMVRFGKWLVDQGRFEDAIWLIQQFITDPDPEETKQNEKRPSLHDSIVKKDKSREPSVITSVMGHLAWTVQALALHKETVLQAYEFTSEVLKRTKDYYVVLEWLIPLIAISGRKVWLKEQSEEAYKDFKELSFSILRKYSKFPALSRAIVHLFYYFRDVTTKEAFEILENLDKAEEFETLLIYFAIFRQRHFKESKYPSEVQNYDPKLARKMLKEKIGDISKANRNLRGGIAWNLWKILSENESEFDTISPWIDEFMKYPYETRLFHNFERVIEEWFNRKPEKCIEWYTVVVKSTAVYATKNPDKARDLWLTTETDQILANIAQYYPDKLAPLVRQLFTIWQTGAYVGSPKGIFQTYKLIDDAKLREEVKKEYEMIYKKMKEMNPKLEEVEF